jgi:predicted HTH domain antitoxin
MSLIISDEILESIGLSETELLQEIAIALFREKKLSIGRASHLVGMNLLEFRRLLASRQISVGYGIDELNEDLRVLEQLDIK